MFSFKELTQQFQSEYSNFSFPETPANLYAPIDYIMSMGGKRIRPLLVMASYNLFKEDPKFAFQAGLAVEVFHNFSLLHDDIMDDALMRRGQDATHIKYDTNAAILSGDAMLIYAYKLLEPYQSNFFKITSMFSQTALEVCEGQRMDMDFESRDDVSIEEYLEMIKLKTSVLIAAALGLGATLAETSPENIHHIYSFGLNMGIAFQIQDDILDTFGEEALVGKKIGGDILQKKKTYLYLKSLDLLSASEMQELRSLYADTTQLKEAALIEKVTAYFKTAHVKVHAEELKLVYQQLAFSHLEAVTLEDSNRKNILRKFAEELLNRKM